MNNFLKTEYYWPPPHWLEGYKSCVKIYHGFSDILLKERCLKTLISDEVDLKKKNLVFSPNSPLLCMGGLMV